MADSSVKVYIMNMDRSGYVDLKVSHQGRKRNIGVKHVTFSDKGCEQQLALKGELVLDVRSFS